MAIFETRYILWDHEEHNMYLSKLEIRNIRSIEHFVMEFPTGEEAGWHVLIGANGSGKSSILRAIALGFIGPKEILRLDPIWEDWLRTGFEKGTIEIDFDINPLNGFFLSSELGARGGILSIEKSGETIELTTDKPQSWLDMQHFFSCGFGPFRRFTGGNVNLEQHYLRNPRIGAHLSLFKEDVALTEISVWLKDVYTRKLEEDRRPKKQGIELKSQRTYSNLIYDGVLHFVNKAGLLPEGFRFIEITADGPFFKDPNGARLHLYSLSEGIKSILSLTFEMIRLMLGWYSPRELFSDPLGKKPLNDFIPVKGVVLIDEIDAHLHPTWQTKIGKWFTKNFPNIQFIVTTHSPLICRGVGEDDKIWRLATPGTEEVSGLVPEVYRKRLIYGDILDAYGTEMFGEQITSSKNSEAMRKRMAELNKKSIKGQISEEESAELQELRTYL